MASNDDATVEKPVLIKVTPTGAPGAAPRIEIDPELEARIPKTDAPVSVVGMRTEATYCAQCKLPRDHTTHAGGNRSSWPWQSKPHAFVEPDELSDWLRSWVITGTTVAGKDGLSPTTLQRKMHEAADKIEEQQREIERLRTIEARAEEAITRYGDGLSQYQDRPNMALYIRHGNGPEGVMP